MKNVEDLRKEAIENLEAIKDGQIKPAHASEINNSIGKIVNSLKVELEYAKLRGEKPEIPFLKYKKTSSDT